MRRFLLTICVGLAIFGVIAWSAGLFSNDQEAEGKGYPASKAAIAAKKKADLGPLLFKGKEAVEPPAPAADTGKDPVILTGSHLAVIDKADISFLTGGGAASPNEGKLLFVGKLVPDWEPNSSRIRYATMYRNGNPILVRYYRLQEGDFLNYTDQAEGEMVALIDPTMMESEVEINRTKLAQARADQKGALALADVYAGEVARLERIRSGGNGGAVADQDYQVAKAQRDKYKYDAASKKEAIEGAQKELIRSQTLLKLFTLRNPIRPPKGAPTNLIQIKTVYKSPGEVVRNQDTVLQVQDLGRLRAEGLVDVQYLDSFKQGQEVIVLPTHREAPYRILRGHRGEITALATSNDKDPFIVSGSEDGTVRVWKLRDSREHRILYMPAAVRSLACSPASNGKHSYLLVGLADGSVQLWDLKDDTSEKAVWVKEEQAGDAINCLAFSPDGTMYATGSEDNSISLWNTADGTKKYTFDAELGHQGGVTALHFTPDLKLVSAGKDNTLRVWTLHEKGATLDPNKSVFTNRHGNVSQLGVSADGKYMLFDQGKALQVLSLPQGRTVGVIQDWSGGAPFETLAAFSPDGSMVLTASSTEGRMQLWKTPTGTGTPRTFEVEQFVTKEVSRPTCAVFGKAQPNAGISPTFAVTGTKDGLIYLWDVPNKDRLDKQLKGRISFKETAIEPSTRQARIWVDVSNKDGLLKPGETVTLVIPRN